MRRVLVFACCLAGLTCAPAVADGAGGPVPPIQGGIGASAPGGDLTYVAVGARGDTIVQQVRRDGGAVQRSRVIRGRWGVPGVTYDGATTGLSADGGTLVLADYPTRYPARDTKLLVLDASRLRVLQRIELPGWYTADAISPDGRWLYLTHYKSANDPLNYEVRAYDLKRRWMLQRPIVDPREPDEKMQGFPLARTVSSDGRWSYTLYDRPEGESFIHALDTAGRTAACIDLPDVAGMAPGETTLRLDRGGDTLRVLGRSGVPLALVDTQTFAVRPPGSGAPPAKPVSEEPAGAGGTPWAFAAVPLAVLAVLLLVSTRSRRSRLSRTS